jgi:putative phosphoesterase
MRRIGLISDTHNALPEVVYKHFKECDEIWHAGDFGSSQIASQLNSFKPLKGVYGNIDGNDIRSLYPEKLIWNCDDVKVFMTHIGGHPVKYAPGIKQVIRENNVKLFICGHSHILRIQYDKELECLYINPGAAGNQGWHKMRTIVRFTINGTEIKDCEVIELGRRESRQTTDHSRQT